jgi:murein DD-endopeptidase MepM/ murein hydrolase activator NlpD
VADYRQQLAKDGKRARWLAITTLALVALLGLVSQVAAQEPAPTATPEPPTYVVQPGDTLYSIAQRFGTTVDAIVAANDIADRSLIRVGQKLIIPTAQPELVPSVEPGANTRVHPVRAGETLPFLAFRYGTTVWALQEVNNLDPLGLLWPGQELVIPPPAAARASTPRYPDITASPAPVVQGRTMAVEVEGPAGLEIRGWFLGEDLVFSGEEGRYWALVGVDALTPPGKYPVALEATEVETGDHLSMQDTFTVTKGKFATYNVPVSPGQEGLLDPAVTQAERAKLNAVFGEVSAEQLWAGPFGYPLAGELRTTAPFGQRRSYGGGPVTSYHSGHDLGADKGAPVYAPMTATVVMAERLQVRGKVVILDHGRGVFTGFWHLSRIDVTVGQQVGQGHVVGLVGNTGLSTGPHLHWEMRVGGVPVAPMQWTRREFP